MSALYDVVAVHFGTRTVRLIAQGMTLNDAESTVFFAVKRRGVDNEVFIEVPSGSYEEGETWAGQKETP